MRKTASALPIILALLAAGCASQRGYEAGPFAAYPRETFIKAGTGETGLYIPGESWCTLIDLRGFKDDGMPLEGANEFLVWKNARSVVASVYAEKLDSVDDDASCRTNIYKRLPLRHTTPVDFRDLGKHRVMVNTVGRKKQINYCPFYKGYCFDFQFSMNAGMDEKVIEKILDSITFVDDMSVKGRFQKVFYVHEKKVVLDVPETWRYDFKTGIQNIPAIVFRPVSGDDFRFHLSPYEGFEHGTSITREAAMKALRNRMAKWEDRAKEMPTIADRAGLNDRIAVYSFDVEDKYCHPDDKGDYPYQRHGFAVIDTSAFAFTIFYRDEGRPDVARGIESLLKMKLMNKNEQPVIELP